MITTVVGIFFVLHGLVHLLYFGQSARFFELQPGMTWPEGSWALSRVLGSVAVRNIAGVLLIIATVGFVVAGVGIFTKQDWWRPLAAGSAIFSSILYILLWNGTLQRLDNQGGIAILINLAILVAVLIFRWPKI